MTARFYLSLVLIALLIMLFMTPAVWGNNGTEITDIGKGNSRNILSTVAFEKIQQNKTECPSPSITGRLLICRSNESVIAVYDRHGRKIFTADDLKKGASKNALSHLSTHVNERVYSSNLVERAINGQFDTVKITEEQYLSFIETGNYYPPIPDGWIFIGDEEDTFMYWEPDDWSSGSHSDYHATVFFSHYGHRSGIQTTLDASGGQYIRIAVGPKGDDPLEIYLDDVLLGNITEDFSIQQFDISSRSWTTTSILKIVAAGGSEEWGTGSLVENISLMANNSVSDPVSMFDGTPLSGNAPLNVSFTDTSTGSPTSWNWSFGDGGISTLQNPSHMYTMAGPYTVSLTATNSGGGNTTVKQNYITVTSPGPASNFTATNISGDSPLTVRFTDTSTGNPTSWNWSFGDGVCSNDQNPVYTYIIAGEYTVSLTVTNVNGTDTKTVPEFVTVICPYSCDTTLTNPPYINFQINSMSCPEHNSGAWWSATCLNNAVIRWAMAGQSSPFHSNLSPWMWKRNSCCPNPGHSWAVDSPANKPIYIAGLYNPNIIIDGNVFSHAIDAELLTSESPTNTTWQSWKFFNYDNMNISIGDWQIPAGNESFWTEVWIKSVDTFSDCGQQDGATLRYFYIAPNGTPFDHPRDWYTTGYLKSQTVKSQLEKQSIPNEMNNELDSIERDRPFTINKWEFDATKKELVIYAHDIKDERAFNNFEKEPIGKYSIRFVHDTEFETTRSVVRAHLNELRKNPNYQINSISMVTDRINDPPGNYAELWVYKSTPENQKLDNTMIQGWKIRVYPVSL